LSEAFTEHLEETKEHAQRLESILKGLDATTRGDKCKAMEGLIEEGSANLEMDASPEVLDALIISIAQKIEHYEIAGYGTARTFAERLGLDEVAEALQETLDEEVAADEKLTTIAESAVNEEAETADQE
jgi:ferritin-like metal-binding protein YciE